MVRFWSSIFVPGLTLILFFLCKEESSVAVSGLIDAKFGAHAVPQTIIINRKLKEKHDDKASSRKVNEVTKEEIEADYPELDPVPSTKPAIKSGPIVHDTSLMPSIPRSKSPDHPMKGHP